MENNNIHVHTFTETVIPPTCKEKGYTLHKCECGYEHKDNFKPIAEHDFDVIEETKPTCTEGGARKATCKVCGTTVDEQLAPLGHSWGQWNISEFATCTEEGKQTRFCGRCGESETQATKPTGHKLIKGEGKKADGYIEHFCENCGETVKVPTKSRKIKDYILAHKITTIVIPSVLVAVAIVALLIFKLFVPGYHYNKANELIEQGEYAQAYIHMTKAIGYKDAGKLIDNFGFENLTSVVYNVDGEKENYFNKKITYDEHGNVISVDFRYDDNEDYTTNTYKNEYDDSGKLIKVFSYDNRGELFEINEYIYNKSGNLSQKISYREPGEINYRYEYKYDKNGNAIASTGYSEDFINTYTYEYNQNGVLEKNICLDKDGIETTTKLTYEYFDDKMIITYKEYDEDGEYTGKHITTYSNVISYAAK